MPSILPSVKIYLFYQQIYNTVHYHIFHFYPPFIILHKKTCITYAGKSHIPVAKNYNNDYNYAIANI